MNVFIPYLNPNRVTKPLKKIAYYGNWQIYDLNYLRKYIHLEERSRHTDIAERR
jgi:GH18 family chitinase